MHPGVYIVLGCFVLLIIWGVSYQKKIKQGRFITIKSFADKHKLAYDIDVLKSGVAKLSGQIQGLQFLYYEEHMPLTDPNDPAIWTVLQFGNCPFDLKFKISQEVGVMKIAKSIGINDTLFGDKELDDAFYFQTSDSDKLKEVFCAKNRENLIEIKDQLNGIIESNNEENTFTYYYFGRIQQAFQMAPVEQVLDFMLKIQESKK